MTPTDIAEITERFAALEAQVQKSDGQLSRTRRQMRVTWAVSALATLVTLTIGWHKDALAQGYGMTLAQAATRIAALETKTASMSVLAASDADNTSGYQTVRFSGVNVQIVNGNGGTESMNGTGNLIVGYNELRTGSGTFGSTTNARTGSHNLVVGYQNNYSSSSGVVFGLSNACTALRANVLGGYQNVASSNQACVSGGQLNQATVPFASVSGGYQNTASGQYASVSGGRGNEASGNQSSVSGGTNNTASSPFASVSGGNQNTASGYISSVSGGNQNTASGYISSVSGGFQNTASGGASSVSGGNGHSAPNTYNWAAGTYSSPQ